MEQESDELTWFEKLVLRGIWVIIGLVFFFTIMIVLAGGMWLYQSIHNIQYW